jgi:hypothetical protein
MSNLTLPLNRTTALSRSQNRKLNQKVHLAKVMSEIFYAQARASKCNHDDIKREKYHRGEIYREETRGKLCHALSTDVLTI